MSLKLLYCCQKLLMDRDLKCFIRENFMQNPNILLVSSNFSYFVFETINLIDRNDGPITNIVIIKKKSSRNNYICQKPILGFCIKCSLIKYFSFY